MEKPSHEILDEVEIVPREIEGGLRGKIVGIKQDPRDSSLWMYKIELYVHRKWVHEDFVHKLGEMKNGLDDGVPIIGK